MADWEQLWLDEMAIWAWDSSSALALDTPIAPPWNGADGVETRLSEYCLYFKMVSMLR